MLSTDKNWWSNSSPFLNRKKLQSWSWLHEPLHRQAFEDCHWTVHVCIASTLKSLIFNVSSLCTHISGLLWRQFSSSVKQCCPVSSEWGSWEGRGAGHTVLELRFLPKWYLGCSGSYVCVCIYIYVCQNLLNFTLEKSVLNYNYIIPQFNCTTIKWSKIIVLQSDY